MAHAPANIGAFALFMYLTGARPGEAISVEWEDIDLIGRTVLIKQSKVGNERTAHLPDILFDTLASLPRIKGRGVFIYTTIYGYQNGWDSVIERAGIKRLTPHCCRHGFATDLLRAGVDVMTVARLGGWKNAVQVLKTYGHAIQDRTLTDVLTATNVTQTVNRGIGKPGKTGTS
jgi:integrase